MNLADAIKIYYDYLYKRYTIQNSINLLSWDLYTKSPKDSIVEKIEIIGTLSIQDYEIVVNPKFRESIKILEKNINALDFKIKKSIYDVNIEYNKIHKIPKDEFGLFKKLCAEAEVKWEEAKHKSDFSLFSPYLEKIVEYNRKFINYRGYEGHPYNTLLDDYEPSMTVDKLDVFFAKIKGHIVPLVKKIANSNKKIVNITKIKSLV